MPLADSYILRKIKRLRTPSLGRSSKNSSNRSTPTTSSTPTSVGPSEVEESFIIHKYFDSKYLSHTLPTPRRIEGVYASAIAVPSSGHDIMNWSTPTASTELETVMHNQIDADSALLASDVWEEPIAAEDGQTTPTSTQPRTPELPDKIMYRGHTLHADQDPSNKGGRISPMMAYIESLCDFNNIFDEVNKSPKFATMPKENPDKQPKGLHHSASEGPVKNILAVPTIDESGRVTPLLLKSSNWRCKSSKVVELTQEWIISRDEEHLTVKGYFIPVEEPPKTDEPEEPIVPRKSVSPSKQALGQGDIDMLRHAIDEVQADLGKALELYQTDVANDVAEIEKAILAMSDQLARHKSPVSAAQAEVSEELLRTRFAEMILNMPHQSEAEESPPPAASKQNPELQAASANPSENYDLLKDPITALKDKLTNLERELVVDEEHSINEELRQIAATPQTAENYKKHKILRRRSENLARMTPLIYFVKDKLTTLEDVVEDNEEKSAAKQSGKTTPAADRKILHVLLWRINSEINNIHELCKKSRHMDSLNTVIEVLSKVCTHLDAILDTLRNWQKPLDLPVLDRVASSKRESREIGTGDADSIVNVNVDFKKDEEHEMTNTFVMFTSNSEKPSLGTNIIVSFTKTPEEQSATYVYNPEAESTTRHDRAGAYIQQSPLTAKRVMSSTVTPAIVEVPFIHLTAPNCSPSSSNANMEVSIHLRRRGDHQQASVELPIGLIKRHLKQFMTGDTNSVQMMCEESDATDTDTTSALFKGTFKSFHPNVGNVQEEEFSSDVMSFTSEDSPLPYRKLLAGQWKTFPGGKTPPLLSPTTDRPNETRSTHDREDEMSYVEITNVRNSWNENYTLSRRARGYKVNASIHPEVKAALAVTFLKDNYEVDIEKYSEKDRDSVVMLEEAYDQKAVRLPESPDRGVDREDTVTPTTVNEDDEPEPSSQSALITDNLGDLSVSVNAPRASDKIYVQVGEVPWGEATMDVRVDQQPQNDDISERSMIFNVMVSENQDEARSQGGSTKSLVTDRTTSQSSLNIPTYVIKHSSTASITCELNNYVNKATEIQWYKGTEPIPVIRGKFDRISHDLLEVLIINHITFDDTELYSIKVNNELYPVAYIIVEDANGNADTNSEDVFDTPNQTMFVMEGQEATFSCQTKDPAAKVTWYRDQELLEPCDRIHILSDGEGFHKVVIQDTDLSDQGTYYACYNGATSHITLVVEERIDEKEVAVSGPETDDEDLNDYLVPPGSTATIACELESTEFLKSLVWQRNNQDLIMNDKLEHVVNGNKHYLIIHNALPEDSGVYSVRINETQFKVAQITIIEGRQTLNTSKTKRISNNSLRSFESKDLYRI